MGIFQKNVCFFIGLKKKGTLTKFNFKRQSKTAKKIPIQPQSFD